MVQLPSVFGLVRADHELEFVAVEEPPRLRRPPVVPRPSGRVGAKAVAVCQIRPQRVPDQALSER